MKQKKTKQYIKIPQKLNQNVTAGGGKFKVNKKYDLSLVLVIFIAGIIAYANSFEDFNKAISLKEDHADAYNNRAIIYFTQDKKEIGCSDAQKACGLGNCKTLEIAESKGDCR